MRYLSATACHFHHSVPRRVMRFTAGCKDNRTRPAAAVVWLTVIGVFAVSAATPTLVQSFAASPTSSTTTTRPSVSSSSSPSSSRLFMAPDNKDNTFNPFNMVGDMASSLLGNSGADSSNPAVDAALTKMTTTVLPDWESIRKQLESQMETSDEERNFRSSLSKGYGVAGSPLHKLRLYDESNDEKDVRVTFYRDSASWCPYCQKVWLCLEEKRIPYRVEKINMRCYGDKPNSFLQIQPGGQIPVAIIDGRVYGQSNDIMYALEQAFPDHKSLSPPPSGGAANDLLRLEREVFGAWMQWLTGSARSKALFVNTLKRVEQELERSGPFFMGSEVTLVDFMYASFLERMAASLLYFKGFQIRVVSGATPTDYPAINRWFDAMETLESYRLTKSDYYTHCWDLPPQLGGCTYERPANEPYTAAINGEGSAWQLPLQPHNGGIEPDWDWISTSAAKRQAVERVSANHENIVAFAARGAGKAGFPPVQAPLADPNAVPNEAVKSAIDATLRTICVAILDSSKDNKDDEQALLLPDDAAMTEIARILVQEGGADHAKNVVDSLSYMRDRVGVPRDMSLPAARQWRAHTNWAISKIVDQLDNK